MRVKHSALMLTAGFLLIPTMSWSQIPGFGGSGGPGGGGMRSGMDPDQLFNFVAKGQDVIRVDELDPFAKQMFDRFASRFGLTGNEITREQFRSAITKVREMASSGQLSGMDFRRGPDGSPGGDSGRFGGDFGRGLPDGNRDRGIEEYFKRLDINEDGELQNHELVGDRVAEALEAERDKYDANHNGMIDLTEFKAYVVSRSDPKDGGASPRDDERKRPTIIRAGNLPRDFPFANLDNDTDGQVGLYEWKAGSRRISEFTDMDLNSDGFLTVEEYYGWRKKGEEESRRGGSMYARGGMMGMTGAGSGAFAMNGPGGGMTGANGFGGGDRMRMGGGPGGFGGMQGGSDRMRGGPGGSGGFGGGSPRGFGGGESGSFGPSSGGDRMRGQWGGGDRMRGPGGGPGGSGDRMRGPGGGFGGGISGTPPSGGGMSGQFRVGENGGTTQLTIPGSGGPGSQRGEGWSRGRDQEGESGRMRPGGDGGKGPRGPGGGGPGGGGPRGKR